MRLPAASLLLALVACGPPSHAPGITVGPIAGLVSSEHTLSRAVGLETLGGVFTELLPAGCSTPCSSTEVFSTASDGQDQITVTVCHGTAALARDNSLVGRFQVFGLSPAPRGTPQVAITFLVTSSGFVVVSATDAATRQPIALRRIGSHVPPDGGA